MSEAVAGETARRVVTVVPHTHWDREWYAPFQTFRLRLVDLLDGVLDRLESGDLPHFLLDGQLAMVDDYLEVRPEAAERIRRLVAAGRVEIGPWYVLMDEFLVSGETIVRDLELGLRRARDFGTPMNVGYLPDMFGHVAQMPQLLRLAGIDHAVVWRGVPAAVDRDRFWWSSPDGSTVLATYLWPEGYGNGAHLPDEGAGLVAAVQAQLALMGEHCTGDVLWMHGTDHQAPSPALQRVVEEANAAQDELAFRVGALANHVLRPAPEGLPCITGELRSGARANLLMGVASNRVDVKQAAARAERALERRAEPLAALFLDEWPQSLLDIAWREVIRNAAHDSICACSHDDVGRAVLHRYGEATDLADGIAERALDSFASTVDGALVAVNPSARTRSGLIAWRHPAGEDVFLDVEVDAADLPSVIAWRSQELRPGTYLIGVQTGDGEITLRCSDRLLTNLVMDEVRAALPRTGRWRVRAVQPMVMEAMSRIEVPGFGWATWTGYVQQEGDAVSVEIADDGTFSIDGLTGFDRLVDSGDAGDTYNYSPPDDDVVIDTPASVDVEVIESHPLRQRRRVRRVYEFGEVVTTIETRAGERLVRVTTEIDNQRRDHRLRTTFPLPQPATTSRAECAFAIVERGRTAEGGPNERPLPTFPSRRFVQAGGLTVVHEGLLEYELTDDRTLALTLLRATGWLSRVDMVNRPLPAGPPDRLEGSQVQGRHVFRYGVAVGNVDPYALVDDMFLPFEVVRGTGGGRPPTGSALTVDGAEVSALRRVDGALEVRVFNPTDGATTVRVADETFELGPWAIATRRVAT